MLAKETAETLTSGLVAVGCFPDLGDAREHALVVLAMNLDCLITVDEEGYVVHGEEAFEEAIRQEFRLYAEEQAMKPEAVVVPIFGSGVELALVWVGLLLYCLAQQLQDPGVTERFLNSAERVMGYGEVYRPFTALFLHADLEHLMGNAVFGLVFGLFVANSFGPLRGWGLILASGFLGNFLNVWIHSPGDFRSLGASTAVFGALGLLVGSGMEAAWRARSYRKGLSAFAPLLAGVMIFTMSGIGGPGTDTLAHMTGLLFGVLLGLPAAYFLARKQV